MCIRDRLVVVQKVTVVLEQCLVAHQNVVQFADAVSVIFRNRDKPLAQTCLIAKRGRNVGGQEGDHGSVKVEAWGKQPQGFITPALVAG